MTRGRTLAAGAYVLAAAGVDEALAGDLAEQLARGRSLQWYSIQVLISIVHVWVDTLLDHKWLAARAIVTGWVLWALFFVGRTMLFDVHAQGWVAVANTAVRYGNWLVIGWAIGVLHRPYQGAMTFAYVLFTLLMSVPLVSRAAVTVLGHPSYNAPSPLMVAVAVVSLMTGAALSAARGRATVARER